MSKSSRMARSGLATVRRDFDDEQPSSSPEYVLEPSWEPTQRPASSARPQTQQKQKASSAGSAERLKAIQAALMGYPIPGHPTAGPSTSTTTPAVSTTFMTSQNKRASPTNIQETAPAPKKARNLPPDWQKDALSASSFNSRQPTPSSSSSGTSFSRRSSLTNTSRGSGSSGGSGHAEDKKVEKVARIFLSQEQTTILKLVENGDSLFYTGSAGTGKSVLLREIIKTLKKKFNKTPDSVAITASTGIAACNIGGVTIHSFAGIGLGVEPVSDLVNRIKKNKKSATRWARTRVLIVDEISMVDGDLFDKLAAIASIIRKHQEPFGGIQLIVTGDFFQLPPVTKGGGTVKFAFEADAWKKALKHTYNLTKVFRQSDPTFVNMLNEMRFGNLTHASIQRFRSLDRPLNEDDGIAATELFPRREDVDRSNSTRMGRLSTEERRYTAIDGGSVTDPNQREKQLSNFMAPKTLELRVDAQVMLIKNVDETLVNGSMGRVIRFVDPAVYGTESDHELGKGEGGVLGATTGPGGSKKPQSSAKIGSSMKYPVVEFLLPGGSRRRMLVTPEVWKVELPSGEVQVSRSQLPLILAWAMSIHKSQGQTLDRVKVDLRKVFEKGQAYVALSRATCLEGLQVSGFDPAKVQAHPKVVAWSKTLSTIS